MTDVRGPITTNIFFECSGGYARAEVPEPCSCNFLHCRGRDHHTRAPRRKLKNAEFKVDIVMMGIRNWFASSLVGITDLCLAEGSWMGEPRFTKLHQRWC